MNGPMFVAMGDTNLQGIQSPLGRKQSSREFRIVCGVVLLPTPLLLERPRTGKRYVCGTIPNCCVEKPMRSFRYTT